MNKLTILTLALGLVTLAHASCPNWSLEEAQQNITNLQQEIAHYDKTYFITNQPIITDTIYDNLVDRLVVWQNCFGFRTKPTKLADTIISAKNAKKTKHYKFMGSLTKINLANIDIFFKKFNNNLIVTQPKIDGIAVELTYDNGILTQVLTRGNGASGMDISTLVKKVPNIPQKLSTWSADKDNKTIVLHGELFLRLDLVPANILKQYSTPRQFIVALIMKKSINMQFVKLVDFFPWLWVNSPEKTDIDSIAKLYQYGYHFPKKFTDITNNVEDFNYFYQYYQQKNKFPFAMDGIVVKINDYKSRDLLGGSKLTPHWATAIKFLSPEVITKVIDIRYSVGRTGKITPTLKLTAVKAENQTLSFVSIGSINNLQKSDIAVNDIISLQVKGKAIAVFEKVLFRPITRIKKDFDSSYNYNKFSCLNYSDSCSQQFKARLLWLTSKQGINIPTITPKILDQLIEYGIVTQLVDIVKIDDLSLLKTKLLGINTKQYLEHNKPSFQQLLNGLSIPYLTEKNLRLLTKKIDNPQALLAVNAEQLSMLLNISAKKASEIIAYIKQPEMAEILNWYFRLIN